MVFLVGLRKFSKCIRTNKLYRWASCIICAVAFFGIYCYVRSIITHTIIHIPIWTWGIIPMISILALLLIGGIKEKTVLICIIFGFCLGTAITGTLNILFYTTNYWFASSHTSYRLDAYVIGKRHHSRTSRRGFSTYNVNLKFSGSKESFVLDDPTTYKKCNRGDTVEVTLYKGLYGIPIIKDVTPKHK